MTHHINAVVVPGELDQEKSRQYDVRTVPCLDGFVLIALDAAYVDFWSNQLNIHGSVSERPLLNFRVVHRILRESVASREFAVIDTDYFGGVGDQSAAVYRDDETLMSPEVGPFGVINEALQILGVKSWPRHDEFATLGLDRYRDWDDLFADYFD